MSVEALAGLRRRLAALLAEAPPAVGGFRHAVRDLVVVGSSSRGGSSIFAETLRQSPAMVHLRAEVNPFLVLHGLGYPQSGAGSDALGAEAAQDPANLDALGADLARDAGCPTDALATRGEVGQFAVDLAVRLSMQWPGEVFATRELRGHVDALVAAGQGVRDGRLVDVDRFHARLLSRLRADHPAINPYYYDLHPGRIAEACPGAPPAEGPPGPLVVEEPPFVCIRPWTRAGADALSSCPLVIKTPSNAYRLPFLAALFPRARVRLLHLTRNVAAAVNGLYDGWRYPGFFSHPLPVPLAIRGYSDRFPGHGSQWWKFDLPPGWAAFSAAPLEQVCAFQWRSAHEALLHAPVPAGDYLRLRFEDVVGPASRREVVAGTLGAWLGTGDDPALRAALLGGLPPVMATAAPRQRRWFERASQLEPVLRDPRNRQTMERLGYDPDPSTWT
mgnify:CR=1 FL=1